MTEKMTEIRWHGRGGQGAKTAATLVAEVAIEEGRFSQGFPDYGPERMGAPMRGYTRISTSPITVHSAIYHPDVVVVLDPTLLDTVDVCEGLSEDGTILINTPLPPDKIRTKYDIQGRKIYTVDATKISSEELGRPIPNTPMIGALIKVTGIMETVTVKKELKKKFAKKFSEKIIKGNLNSIDRAFKEVKGE